MSASATQGGHKKELECWHFLPWKLHVRDLTQHNKMWTFTALWFATHPLTSSIGL